MSERILGSLPPHRGTAIQTGCSLCQSWCHPRIVILASSEYCVLFWLLEGHSGRSFYGVPCWILRCLRHHLHPVLLSVPVLDDAQSLLYHLPYFQLGLHYDLHTPDGIEKSPGSFRLHPFGNFAASLGDYALPSSGVFL